MINRDLYWTPRILSIVFILFLALFSLDVFGNGYGLWETVLGLLIHNIPSIILTVILVISWKYEIVGAIAFILAGLAYIIMTAINASLYLALSWGLIIAGPAFLIGVLFYLNWIKKKIKLSLSYKVR